MHILWMAKENCNTLEKSKCLLPIIPQQPRMYRQGFRQAILPFFLLFAMLGEVVGALHSLTYINPYSTIDPGCAGPG